MIDFGSSRPLGLWLTTAASEASSTTHLSSWTRGTFTHSPFTNTDFNCRLTALFADVSYQIVRRLVPHGRVIAVDVTRDEELKSAGRVEGTLCR